MVRLTVAAALMRVLGAALIVAAALQDYASKLARGGRVMGRPARQSKAKPASSGNTAVDGALSVLNSAVNKVPELPPHDRGPTLWLIVVVAFAIVALAIAGLIASRSGTTVNGASCSQTAGGTLSGGSVNCGGVPPTE